METKTKQEIAADIIKAIYSPGNIEAITHVTVGFLKTKKAWLALEWLGVFLAIVGFGMPMSSIWLIVAKAIDIAVAICLWAAAVNVEFVAIAVDRINKKLNIDLTEEP